MDEHSMFGQADVPKVPADSKAEETPKTPQERLMESGIAQKVFFHFSKELGNETLDIVDCDFDVKVTPRDDIEVAVQVVIGAPNTNTENVAENPRIKNAYAVTIDRRLGRDFLTEEQLTTILDIAGISMADFEKVTPKRPTWPRAGNAYLEK